MTQDELTRSRIKCMIRYPNSPFPVGAILEQDFEESNWYHYYDSLNRHFILEDPQIYPEVFNEIQWWEDRKPEDMPEYFKVGDIGATIGESPVYKIGIDAEWQCWEETIVRVKYKSGGGTLVEYVIPATEADYNAYINKQ